MILLQSEKLDNVLSNILDHSPISSIELFENLSDDYNMDHQFMMNQTNYIFDNLKDAKDLLNDYDTSEKDANIFEDFIIEDRETISQLEEIKNNNLDQDWINSLSDYGIIGWGDDKIFFKDSQSKNNWISKGYEIL